MPVPKRSQSVRYSSKNSNENEVKRGKTYLSAIAERCNMEDGDENSESTERFSNIVGKDPLIDIRSNSDGDIL